MLLLSGSNRPFSDEAETIVPHGKVSGCVGPVFKHSLFGDELIEVSGLIAGSSSPESMVVGALDDGDGIDLNVAEVFDGFECGGFRRAFRTGGKNALGEERELAGFGDGEGGSHSCGSTFARRWTG